VPFCAHHCGYCDFAVVAGRDSLIDRYLDALAAEVATLGTPCPVETLFFGGGTPTHLAPEQLDRLFTTLARWLPVAPGGEVTVEANPDTLTADKVAALGRHGVTRVSLGAQSFSAATLAVLERSHDPAAIAPAVGRVKAAGMAVSLDLIFGVPGQTAERWRADLDAALALDPDHVSTYGLTYEKGTPLWKQRRAGRLVPLGEDAELAMYRLAIDVLQAAGLEHYEVSNFARPGRRSRHNQVYWANHAYHGFGLGAARYVHGVREVNTRDLDGYVRKALAGEPVTRQSERLGPEERARETMAVQLRRLDGIDRPAFREQAGFDLDAVAGGGLAWLVERGLLRDDGRRVALTRKGLFVADAVVARLL
jgi:oxygen-independent coproporphyrinogen-3 oxidase